MDIMGQKGKKGADMYQENIVLCGANSYTKKYFFNNDFNGLPEQIKKELNIMCVVFTEAVGGAIRLEYEDDGTLIIKTECEEYDAAYDEIGSGLKVGQLRTEKRELLESLEMYYKVFFLGEDAE